MSEEIEEQDEEFNSDELEVGEDDESIFPINENLELIYHNGIFNLLSSDSYIIFKDPSIFIKTDDMYTATQEDNSITISAEELEMIERATQIYKDI